MKKYPYLAVLLIRLKQQREGIMVKMPEPSSKEEKVWCSYDYNTDLYIVKNIFIKHFTIFIAFLDRYCQVN